MLTVLRTNEKPQALLAVAEAGGLFQTPGAI